MAERPPSLLAVEDLRVEFRTAAGTVNAVNGVSFEVGRGETLAILGESGSGKSVTASVLMDILDSPPGRIAGGRVLFDGEDLLALGGERRRALSGSRIAMVFQDALIALNPVYSVGWQIAEVLRAHGAAGRREAWEAAVALLDRVGIPAPRTRARDYPHQLSGGQRQRVMIAVALALGPDLLIADEPTTALDVTIQAQIMDLLADLRRETGMALVLITHDLGLVAESAVRVAVMFAGRIVESAPTRSVFDGPAHPYTLGLMHSVPSGEPRGEPLHPIPGAPPDLSRIPAGCPFHPRCALAVERCRSQLPKAVEIEPGHLSACHRVDDVRAR